MPYAAAVLTVSDSVAQGRRTDLSGPALKQALEQGGYTVSRIRIVADDARMIANAIRELGREARLVVTTGGTGLGPRDVTPDATRSVCERTVDGISELIRSEGRSRTPFASLSRAICGLVGTS